MTNIEKDNFQAIAKSKLSECFVSVDGQPLRPDSIIYIKGSADWPDNHQSMLGTNGMPDGTPTRYKMNLRERLALGDDGSVVSLRGQALNLGEPVLLQTSDNGEGYRYIGDRRLARLIYSTWNGPIPHGLEVDHFNRKRDDDRLCNLRLVTHAANMRNRSPVVNSSWLASDLVLLIPIKSGDPVLVHPTAAYALVRSPNTWKLLHGHRRTANGWFAIVNPSQTDVTAYFRICLELNRAGLMDKCLALLASKGVA